MGAGAAVVVHGCRLQQIWRELRIYGRAQTSSSPAAGAVGWVAPEIKQRQPVYERPSCKELILGKMLAIETMPLCASYLQYTRNKVLIVVT